MSFITNLTNQTNTQMRTSKISVIALLLAASIKADDMTVKKEVTTMPIEEQPDLVEEKGPGDMTDSEEEIDETKPDIKEVPEITEEDEDKEESD